MTGQAVIETIGRIHFGYRLNDKRAKWLVPYMRGWSTALKRYSKLHGDEAPYYFNERASLSLLAAGAWLAGATALEEYGTEKGWASNKGHGRCDLYISDHEYSAEFEGKQKWMSASTSDAKLRATINLAVEQACDDARNNYGADAKFGCVFFVPRFSKRRFPNYTSDPKRFIRREIQRYVHAVRTVHLWSWCFPSETRILMGGRLLNSYYPGTIMAFRGVKYWN